MRFSLEVGGFALTLGASTPGPGPRQPTCGLKPFGPDPKRSYLNRERNVGRKSPCMQPLFEP